MKDILTYALGVVVCSGMFTVFYRTAMYRWVAFRVARIYLAASLVAAAIIPALDIPVWRVAAVEIPLVAGPVEVRDTASVEAVATADRVAAVLWVLYGVGIAVLAVVMARQFVRIARIRRRAEVLRIDGFTVAFSADVDAPFSFLGTIFMEWKTPDAEMWQIVLHEASHIRHRHSGEKIAMEAIKSLMWFNPFGWWAACLLAEVHEFEADRDVLDGGATVEEYLPLIFRRTFGYIPELSVGFGDSLTKKRLSMIMNKMRISKYSWLRVAGALPLAAVTMMLFSFTSRQPEIIYTEVTATDETAAHVAAAVQVPAPAVQEPQKSETEKPGAIRIVSVDGKVDGKNPLIILDGKEISGDEMDKIELDTIESISVLKDVSATDTYGVRAKDGVIIITSKGTIAAPESANTPAMKEITVVGYGTQRKGDIEVIGRSDAGVVIRTVDGKSDGKTPLIILDGKEIANDEMQDIDPETIESISVLKDATATATYGERAKDGAIIITSKTAKE